MQLRFTAQNVAYLLSSISLGTTVSNTQERLETMVMQKFVQKAAVGRYTCTLGDKLQQTRRGDRSLHVYRSGD